MRTENDLFATQIIVGLLFGAAFIAVIYYFAFQVEASDTNESYKIDVSNTQIDTSKTGDYDFLHKKTN